MKKNTESQNNRYYFNKGKEKFYQIAYNIKKQKQNFYLKVLRDILTKPEIRVKLAYQYKHVKNGYQIANLPECLLCAAYCIEDPDLKYSDNLKDWVAMWCLEICKEAEGLKGNSECSTINFLANNSDSPRFLKQIAKIFIEEEDNLPGYIN